MGRRSISTTKSGKFMNPTDQARKEARKRELKKNKKQRQMVRAAVLKGKDPQQLITDMEKIDQMEYNVNFPSPLNEKVLKDKRKKMKETWDRVMRLYHKEDPERWDELKRMELEYETRRFTLIRYYESVKYAQSVQVDDIPLPEAPVMDLILPSQIPLPSEMPAYPFLRSSDMMHPTHSILKKKSTFEVKSYLGSRKPPGVPPGPPPELSEPEEEEEEEDDNDDDDLEEGTTTEKGSTEATTTNEKKQSGKSRKIRFADEEDDESETPASKVGEDVDMEEVDPESITPADIPMPPMPLQPGIGLPTRLPPGPPPMMFRPPLRPGGIRMLPPGIPPPPGSRPTGLPPGPPPGLPPRLAHIRLPPGPPPGLPPVRLLRPPLSIGPMSKVPTSNVVSAPPSLIARPAKGSEEEKRSATIEAKPQLRSLSAELTKFLPTTLRVKREDKLRRGPPNKNSTGVESVKEMPMNSVKATVQGPTKDDTYEQFMKEMSGLL